MDWGKSAIKNTSFLIYSGPPHGGARKTMSALILSIKVPTQTGYIDMNCWQSPWRHSILSWTWYRAALCLKYWSLALSISEEIYSARRQRSPNTTRSHVLAKWIEFPPTPENASYRREHRSRWAKLMAMGSGVMLSRPSSSYWIPWSNNRNSWWRCFQYLFSWPVRGERTFVEMEE